MKVKQVVELGKKVTQRLQLLPVIWGVGLVVFCLLLYRGISDCGFHHDDVLMLNLLEKEQSYYQYIATPLGVHFNPLLKINLSVMYFLFGKDYHHYYWILLAGLIILSLLVWWLIVELGGSQAAGFVAALFVCSHPCLTDALTWPSGSWMIFLNIWGILSIILMGRFFRSGSWVIYILALLSYLICVETSEYAHIYLAFLFYCFFWRHKESIINRREAMFYFRIPLIMSIVVLAHWYYFYYLPDPAGGGYRIAAAAQRGMIARNYVAWLADGLGRYLGLWPEFDNPHTPPSAVIYNGSLAMLFLFLLLVATMWRRVTRLQVIGLIWTLTAVVSFSLFVPNHRYLAIGLPGFLMFLCPLLTEEVSGAGERSPRLRFVNLLVILFIVGHFARSSEVREKYWIQCNKQQEFMRDKILETFADIPEGANLVVCVPKDKASDEVSGRLRVHSIGPYLQWYLRSHSVSVKDLAVDLATSVPQLCDVRLAFVHDARKAGITDTTPPLFFCLWDGKTARDVTDAVPLDKILIQVKDSNVFAFATRHGLPLGFSAYLDDKLLPLPAQVTLPRGDHYLYLPAGLTLNDVSVQAVGREYSSQEFEALTGGSAEGDWVVLFGESSRFEVPTMMTAGSEYRIAAEAENSRIKPVIIALRTADGKAELGRLTFGRKDGSFSWEEVAVKPQAGLVRIQVAFVNDYTGPEGDLNAVVRRVRILRPGSPAK
ncbi:hypothetical protein FJY63_04835 [Candidatus Sumerlaeota bacterium]|nr:hypothetical protein [Candidatus Sumerlaeota bacterium]